MRLLGHLQAPAVPDRAPRVLGVDEFAFRRGRRYGTILVDVETHQLVDVLPDRTSETLAAWLHDQAGAEVVCRDRASAYTRAVKEAAPDATEVADRWHLLRNTCHSPSNGFAMSTVPACGNTLNNSSRPRGSLPWSLCRPR
jgi:transposase